MNARVAITVKAGHRESQYTLDSLATFALKYADVCHAGQTRANGLTEYIEHPKRVIGVLIEHGYTDPALLAAAALHDVVEDTDASIDEIRAMFGADIAELVGHVTDPPGLSRDERRVRQLARIIDAPPDAQALKLADRISNVREAIETKPWPADKMAAYLQHAEVMAVLVRKAHPKLAATLLRLADGRPFSDG